MSHVLLATCSRLPDGDEDAAALGSALSSCGVQPVWKAWDDPAVDWSSGLVVLRSTWDYPTRRSEFLTWAAAVPRLANPVELVTWSSDKRYLADLADAGVPLVPTTVAGPGMLLRDTAAARAEFVVKPAVGAGSGGVGRFRADDAGWRAAAAHVESLRRSGYTALVQPYLSDVDTHGETALVYVDGTFSHAARKGPMLPADVRHPLSGADLYVAEAIAAREPSTAELAVGDAALAAVRARCGADPLYARVDLLPAPDGPVVVELELVEPSLFLDCSAAAAKTFATAIAARA